MFQQTVLQGISPCISDPHLVRTAQTPLAVVACFAAPPLRLQLQQLLLRCLERGWELLQQPRGCYLCAAC
jgi:hypothetical protein